VPGFELDLAASAGGGGAKQFSRKGESEMENHRSGWDQFAKFGGNSFATDFM